jgi:hypothetical protein
VYPDQITRDQLFAVLDVLGIGHDRAHICRIEIDPLHVLVTRFKANARAGTSGGIE